MKPYLKAINLLKVIINIYIYNKYIIKNIYLENLMINDKLTRIQLIVPWGLNKNRQKCLH